MMQPANGEPDRDFAAMMIPHRQGAIDMAEAGLRFGPGTGTTDTTAPGLPIGDDDLPAWANVQLGDVRTIV